MRWIDAIVTGGLMVVLAFTAIAFGAVHQWAYTLMELALLALLILWMARIWLEGATPARIGIGRGEFQTLAAPLALMGSLLIFQIAPLPPSVMRVVSPMTHRLYVASFPGWPQTSPFHGLMAAWNSKALAGQQEVPIILPPVGGRAATRARAAAPDAATTGASERLSPPSADSLGRLGDMRWRSISIAPWVTWAGLIEAAVCASLFFVVLLYPFGSVGGEREAAGRFTRRLVIAIVSIASAVALVAIAQRAAWNGRILWFFVPHDWSGPLPTNIRASGPFVNADHFANYLAMVLPVAVVGAIFPMPSTARRRERDLRVPFMVASFMIAAGIVLSLSRGGWIISALGVVVALCVSLNRAKSLAPALLRRYRAKAVPLTIAAFALFALVVLFVIGPIARSQATERIGEALGQKGALGYKPAAWRDTLGMMRDFPIFGVGLGCWPELFPHYQRPPWSEFYFRQPENDYVQLVAETGIAGSALVIWFAAVVWRRLRDGARRLSERQWPLFAGLGAGLLAALVHELFDFSLHTPANALLFAVILALALRIAMTHATAPAQVQPRSVAAPSPLTFAGSAAIASAACGLILAAVWQQGSSYPYDLGDPRTFADAETAVASHPANSGLHLSLVATMPRGAPAALKREELRAAVWLDPNDPVARDLYARSLLLDNKKQEGLEQVALSVFHSPKIETHYYLRSRVIPWLLPEEQRAISRGFSLAIANGYGGANEALAQFYDVLGRYIDAADIFVKAASATDDDGDRLAYLVNAGEYFAKANDMKEAEQQFRAALAIDPADTRTYREMIYDVMGPQKDVARARAVARDGIGNGADPVALDIALAAVAHAAADTATAETALREAFKYEPTFDSAMRLGQLYLDERKYDRATLSFQQAVQLDPRSARAYFNLGQAEEGAFDYASASKDYARAVALAPRDKGMRENYLEFQQRTADAAKPSPGG